jgi:hypothetical protein
VKTNGIGFFKKDADGNFVLGSINDLRTKEDFYLKSLENARIQYSEILDVVGLNKLFFVCLTNIDDTKPQNGQVKPLGREICLARMEKRGKKVYLIRETPMYHCHYNEDGTETKIAINKEEPKFYDFSNDGYFFAYCYVPTSVNESLPVDNAVICSIEPFTPSPVVLDERTLLGRLDDVIQSIDGDELRQILNGDGDSYLKLSDREIEHVFNAIKNKITDVIRDTRDAITTYSEKIDMLNRDAVMSSSILQAKPEYTDSDRPKKPRAGMIIFNNETKSFEGYNGKTWKILKME